MPDTNIATEPQLPSTESSPAAYQRLLPQIMAEQEERPVNVDVMYVVTLILGSLPRIRALRDELLKLPGFEPSLIDDLDDQARALQHSHGLYLQATKSPQALQSLLDRATALRDVLLADATALAKRGLLNPDAFREVKRNNGHRALVVDLQILVATFNEKLSELSGRSSVNAEELNNAVLLIDTLTEAIGTKEHSPAMREETIQIRAKALNMVARNYEEVRNSVIYIRRRHGDADGIAPSLYSNRAAPTRSAPSTNEDSGTTGVHPIAGNAATPTLPSTTAASADLSATLAQNGPFKRTAGEG